jgi:hypothetical protein
MRHERDQSISAKPQLCPSTKHLYARAIIGLTASASATLINHTSTNAGKFESVVII